VLIKEIMALILKNDDGDRWNLGVKADDFAGCG
jgi:hypothetical protein